MRTITFSAIVGVILMASSFVKAAQPACFTIPPDKLQLLEQIPALPVQTCISHVEDEYSRPYIRFGTAQFNYSSTDARGMIARTVQVSYENDPYDNNDYPVTGALLEVIQTETAYNATQPGIFCGDNRPGMDPHRGSPILIEVSLNMGSVYEIQSSSITVTVKSGCTGAVFNQLVYSRL